MDGLFWVRVACVGTFALSAAAIAVRFDRASAALKRFFFEPQAPHYLALTRVCIFYLLFDFTLDCQPWRFAAIPREFASLPPGWSFWGEHLPITVPGVIAVKWVAVASSGLAMLGVATRISTAVAALSALYTLGIPNFYLSIGHAYHVPVLSGLILALSPCGDALSVDAWLRQRRGRPPPPAQAAYTTPIRFCWLLLGTMYLFPGLWKLWEAGDGWILGDKVKAELFAKWAQLPEFYPAFRIDKSSALLALLGTGTLLLEVSFFFAMFNPVTRVVAGVAAMLFHIGILLEMAIGFSWIHPLIVLFDPRVFRSNALKPLVELANRVRARLRARFPIPTTTKTTTEPPLRRQVGPSFVFGSVCIAAMVITGFGPLDSYPIGVYPRFSSRNVKIAATSSVFAFALRTASGSERRLGQSQCFSEGALFKLLRDAQRDLKQHHRGRFEHKLELVRNLAKIEWGPFEPGDTLLVYRQDFTVDPDLREPKNERSEFLIDEFSL